MERVANSSSRYLNGIKRGITRWFILHMSEKLAEGYGAKIGVKHLAGLAGMLHDVGKYSEEFQEYLHYAVAHPEDYSKRGTVDHSTAGGRVLHNEPRENIIQEWLGMIVGNAIISHHGSLGDYLSPVNLRQSYLERVVEKELPDVIIFRG